MRRFLGILVVLYLAMAPGMNVAQLLHSVSLCQYFQTQVSSNDCSHHHHSHDDSHDDNDQKDDQDHDHHDENIIVETGVMGAAPTVFRAVFVTVYMTSNFMPEAKRTHALVANTNPRAPPWVLHSKSIKLNI
ncbi:hypothetical protein OAU50_02110 [Planctomycetota bacterium]|nr:hypothetical protein [Planctomycetota bacterium]